MVSSSVVAFAVLALAALANAASRPAYEVEFVSFMKSHAKTYSHGDFQTRFAIFRKNLDFVLAHDAEAKGFTVAINKFSDLSSQEFAAMFNGFDNEAHLREMKSSVEANFHVANGAAPPDTQDWRSKGAVTPIKDQGQCGSCYSFSSTGSMEATHFLSGQGSLVGLSEQNLVDCSQSYGNQGCRGGLMAYCFKYVKNNGGIDSEAFYPYEAQVGQCRFSADNVTTTIDGFKYIVSGSESDLFNAIGTVQPISVAIDASWPSFQAYSGGVYYEPQCSTYKLDHAVLAVGYGSANGTPYYLVKNSWGTNWGMKGYIWMSRDKSNNCGIATAASYSVINH